MSSRGTSPRARLARSLALAAAAATLVLPVSPSAARTCAPEPPAPPATTTSVPVLAAATQIRWTRVTRTLTYGADAVVEGQVVTEGGALGDARVELYARPRGAASWSRVGSATTDAETGVFSFGCVMPPRTTAYRVEYAGDGLHAASRSTRTVRVARAFVEDMRRSGAAAFRLDGALSPEYAGPVLLAHRVGDGRWTVIGRDRADRRSHYGFTIDVSRVRGVHEYRAVVPAGDGFARSTGGGWRITVR